jgi:hypothetical protein
MFFSQPDLQDRDSLTEKEIALEEAMGDNCAWKDRHVSPFFRSEGTQSCKHPCVCIKPSIS